MYDFKMLPELGWAVVTGLAVVLGEALITFDESVFTDPRAYGVALMGSAARAVGASVLNTLRRQRGTA